MFVLKNILLVIDWNRNWQKSVLAIYTYYTWKLESAKKKKKMQLHLYFHSDIKEKNDQHSGAGHGPEINLMYLSIFKTKTKRF